MSNLVSRFKEDLQLVSLVALSKVSPIVPSKKTLYPASPSLQRVAWASLPLLLSPVIPDYRYYDPLRLPIVHLVRVCYSLSAHNTLLACPQAALLSDWLSFGQMGLESFDSHPLGNNNQFHLLS